MKPSLFLCLSLLVVAGCHEKAPSNVPESVTPIVPPFASGLIEEPTAGADAHSAAGGAGAMAVIQQARDRLANNPRDLDALVFLGNANYDIQRYQEAEGLYRRALEIDSENAEVRTDLATVLYRLGRSKEAVEELQRALAIDYHHENALYNLGMMKLEAFNDREGAVAAWTQLKEATKDQQLIARLDQMIAQVRQAPPQTASKPAGASKPPAGSGGSSPPSGKATSGTVLQLPANPGK